MNTSTMEGENPADADYFNEDSVHLLDEYFASESSHTPNTTSFAD